MLSRRVVLLVFVALVSCYGQIVECGVARLAVQRIELIAPGRLETGGITHATGFVQVERERLALRIDMPDEG